MREIVCFQKMIEDKDYIGIVLSIIAGILFVIKKYSLFSLCVATFLFWREMIFLNRLEKLVKKACDGIIENFQNRNPGFDVAPISKELIKEIIEKEPSIRSRIIKSETIAKGCWEKLRNEGYIYWHPEIKGYVFNKSLLL